MEHDPVAERQEAVARFASQHYVVPATALVWKGEATVRDWRSAYIAWLRQVGSPARGLDPASLVRAFTEDCRGANQGMLPADAAALERFAAAELRRSSAASKR